MRGKPARGNGRAAGPQVGLGSLLSVPSLMATQGRLPAQGSLDKPKCSLAVPEQITPHWGPSWLGSPSAQA